MMTPPTSDGPAYRRFAWHYDLTTRDLSRPGEIEFYRALAAESAGPVLEPACGAGRVLARLTEAGRQLWGTDSSPEMLELCAANLARAGAAAELRCQPLNALDLAMEFGLILLPLDAFRLLGSRSEQLGFLAAAALLLRPDGRLALDLTLPHAVLPEPSWGPALPAPGGGTVRSRPSWQTVGSDQIEETWFEVTEPEGAQSVVVSRDRFRLVTASDLAELLGSTGWRIERWQADFHGTPMSHDSIRLVVVAAPGGRVAA